MVALAGELSMPQCLDATASYGAEHSLELKVAGTECAPTAKKQRVCPPD